MDDPSCRSCQRRLREARRLAESIQIESLPSVAYTERARLPATSAVYFALRESVIIYIGESSNLRRRWKSHDTVLGRTNPKDLAIAWCEMADSQGLRRRVESSLIKRFRPTLQRSALSPSAVTASSPARFSDRTGLPPLTKDLMLKNRAYLLNDVIGLCPSNPIPIEKFSQFVLLRCGIRMSDSGPIFLDEPPSAEELRRTPSTRWGEETI